MTGHKNSSLTVSEPTPNKDKNLFLQDPGMHNSTAYTLQYASYHNLSKTTCRRLETCVSTS